MGDIYFSKSKKQANSATGEIPPIPPAFNTKQSNTPPGRNSQRASSNAPRNSSSQNYGYNGSPGQNQYRNPSRQSANRSPNSQNANRTNGRQPYSNDYRNSRTAPNAYRGNNTRQNPSAEYSPQKHSRQVSEYDSPYRYNRNAPEYDTDFYDGEEDFNEREERKQKTKKRRGPVKRFFRFILALLLVFCILFGGVYVYALGLISFSGYKRTSLEQNSYISPSALSSSQDVTNILLLGIDSTSDSNQSTRSDTMILLSIDRKNKAFKFSSFLRDTWVEIPDYGSAKLNASFAHGSAQLASDTIECTYGIDIDNYVLVNFDIFIDIIDTLGGVTVDVKEKEADFINRTTRYTIDSGEEVALNGEEALVYCRIRKLDSDFMRTYRQRKVMNAIFAKVKRTSPSNLIEIAKKIIPQLETSLSPVDAANLFVSGLTKLLSYDSYSLQVPAKGTWQDSWKGNQQVITCDTQENSQIIHDFIYENELSHSDNAPEKED